MTRSTARLATLGDGAASHIEALAGSSASARHAAELVAQHAWSERTEASRQSQWKAWVEFCTEDGRYPISVTEGSLVAFIG